MWTPVCMEPTLKYHPLMFDVLTWTRMQVADSVWWVV